MAKLSLHFLLTLFLLNFIHDILSRHFLWDQAAFFAHNFRTDREIRELFYSVQVFNGSIGHDVDWVGKTLARSGSVLGVNVALPVVENHLFKFLETLQGSRIPEKKKKNIYIYIYITHIPDHLRNVQKASLPESWVGDTHVLCPERHSEHVDIAIWVVLWKSRLPTAHSHLSVSCSSHGALVNVGAAHNNVSIVNNHHFGVDINREPERLPRLKRTLLV